MKAPGLVLEFEHLPAMTERPEWGAELTRILKAALIEAHEKNGMPSALRVTPTDIREKAKPPLMRRGEPCETLFRSFEASAEAGADILSIESVGGKEVHDKALMFADIPGIAFALGVLSPRDMTFLWGRIREICDAPSGRRLRRRFRLRLRQHRHAARRPEDAARGAGGGRARDERAARSRCVRAGRA